MATQHNVVFVHLEVREWCESFTLYVREMLDAIKRPV
jgi:hypothetical protein